MHLRKISCCHQDFLDLIHKMVDVFNLTNVKFIVEYGCDDIDSFLSGLYKVNIEGYASGHKIKQSVIMKWHPDPIMRTSFRELYKREFVFYRQIVPKLLEIQRSFKIIEGLKMKFPNCIFASAEYDKETIAVVGLQEDGFRFHDRFIRTDLSYASLVMKNLAKFHALSFILAKWSPRDFEDIKNVCNKDVQYSDIGEVSKRMRAYYDLSVNVVSDFNLRQKLRDFGPHIYPVLQKCTSAIARYSTLCHGDCWNNNILFKVKGGRPVDVVFIDYQMIRLASPVTDIFYYLYMATDRDFLNKHYDQVLEIYYGTLTAVLRQCDSNVDEIYPKAIFQKHIKEYSVLGLIEALVAMKIITAPCEEALKMTERMYLYCNEESLTTTSSSTEQSNFIERVNSVVSDFFSRNFSLDAVLHR